MTTEQQPAVTTTPGKDPFRQLVYSSGLDFFASLPGTSEHENKRKAWVEGLSEFLQPGSDSSPAQKGSALLFLDEVAGDSSFAGLPPERATCQEISKDKETVLEYHWGVALELCEKLIWKSRERKTHQKRRHGLDQAIKRLLRLEKEITGKQFPDEDRVRLALARAYYLRGKIIRPKGFTVPAKKIETLKYAEEKLAELVNNDKTGEACRLRAMIHIDLAALKDGDGQEGKPDNYREVLAAAVQTFSSSTGANKTEEIERIHIILARAEDDPDWANNGGGNLLQGILGNPQAPILQKARASLLLNDTGAAIRNARAAIATMTKKALAFSHEDWRLLVLLLRELRNRTTLGSDDLILEAWKEVSRLERSTKRDLHVRWYWSRQRDLYDLAFHAAGRDYATKARIADSLKARPALHLSQAADLGLAVEQMEMGFLDRYILGLTEKDEAAKDALQSDTGSTLWPKLPKPWIAVHYYLSNGFGLPVGEAKEKLGYALIHDSEKNAEESWTEKEFNYHPIWSAYMTWQENYQASLWKNENDQDRSGQEAATDLERLCRTMGRDMDFLFDTAVIPPERPVVFIPHEFLHRIPIHMALQAGENQVIKGCWMQTNPSSYLPALWLHGENNAVSSPGSTVPLALIKWKNPDTIVSTVQSSGGTTIVDASKDDLLSMNSSPNPLIVYCHGHGHPANPFASSLDLIGQPTVLDILRNKKFSLEGVPVFLGACETDLVPPMVSSVDEHLSLSFAFLQKGAPELLGSLWKDLDAFSAEILENHLNNRYQSMSKSLWRWSGGKISRFLRNPHQIDILYKIAPFRCLGLTPWGDDIS
jgi:hypothetical protein